MSIKRQAIRFNLENEPDKKAWELLQSIGKMEYKSVNKFIISLLSIYADKQQSERTETEFIDRVISAIRDELKSNAALNIFQMLGQLQQPIQNEKNSDENDASALGFLSDFGGDN